MITYFFETVPTRIIYINGLKGIRKWLGEQIKPNDYQYPNLIRVGTVLAPGLMMTPMSSILEAVNAGVQNPEPLSTRWMRGLMPRAVREVIFAIGIYFPFCLDFLSVYLFGLFCLFVCLSV
jgi:hypothetical protein